MMKDRSRGPLSLISNVSTLVVRFVKELGQSGPEIALCWEKGRSWKQSTPVPGVWLMFAEVMFFAAGANTLPPDVTGA
jgi:hypothetical protein